MYQAPCQVLYMHHHISSQDHPGRGSSLLKGEKTEESQGGELTRLGLLRH